MIDLIRARRMAEETARVWIGEDEGQTALLINGVVQSVLVGDGPLGPGYWPYMLPDVRPDRALLLGLGGGTIAHLLTRRFGPLPIVGVESDPQVIRLGRSAFGLDLPHLEIVHADAFAYVASAEGPFGYVAVDLFASDTIPRQVFARPFLKRVRELLTPGGLAAINLFRDRRTEGRVRRIAAVFPRVDTITSRENVIARCRPR